MIDFILVCTTTGDTDFVRISLEALEDAQEYAENLLNTRPDYIRSVQVFEAVPNCTVRRAVQNVWT